MKSAKHPAAIYSTLPDGLRVIQCPRKGEVEYFGVVINAGSRDEDPRHEGLAHFVEHTIFKGTARRRSWHIINRMEAVGGELNAYTTKEETVIYTVFPRGALARAAELVADLVFNSVFPERELDKEREVVEDEISSYLDTPADSVFDDFDEHLFAGSSMAHNILGSGKALGRFDSAACREWTRSHYLPERMVLFYGGAASIPRLEAVIAPLYGGIDSTGAAPAPARTAPAVNPVFDITLNKHLHQSHTVAGMRIPPFGADDNYAFALAVNILGGPGMNSMLNLQMRERQGLVYSVEASTALYSDCGLMSVYFGCDHDDESRCRDILRSCMGRLSKGLTRLQLDKAKKQFKGQLALARAGVENTVIASARRTLLQGRALSPAEIDAEIDALTTDRFAQTAAAFAPEALSFLTFK